MLSYCADKTKALVLAAAMLIACAKNDPQQAILEISKRDAATYCSERSQEGCEFVIVRTPDGWGVTAKPMTRTEEGGRVYVPGLWRSYSYDQQGNLQGVVPGL